MRGWANNFSSTSEASQWLVQTITGVFCKSDFVGCLTDLRFFATYAMNQTCSSASVGFCPIALKTAPSSFELMTPSWSVSNLKNASWKSPICSSVRHSAEAIFPVEKLLFQKSSPMFSFRPQLTMRLRSEARIHSRPKRERFFALKVFFWLSQKWNQRLTFREPETLRF